MNDERSGTPFPADFIFGAATAAYQIEGSPQADGKGPSVWDEFVRRKGAVRTGETGDQACDHYRRMGDDVALIKELGLDAYRFSISWPRVQPSGRGAANGAGLDFYSRLVDALLAAGIRPFPTLFHWDTPLALQREKGGFLSRDAAERFGDYAELVVRSLGDRVKDWITVNEPFEHAVFGHFFGSHAPGLKRPWAYPKVMHHILLAHAAGMERIRAFAPGAAAGPVLSQTPVAPLVPGRDEKAAFLADQFMNRITLDPILKGRYPEELSRALRAFWPRMEADDLARVSAPCDFIGLNYYSRERASRNPLVPFLGFWVTGKDGGRPEGESGGTRTTAMGWEVWPRGLEELLLRMRDEYGNPRVIVTENGAAFTDEVERGAGAPRVRDRRRVEFLRDYVLAMKRAMDAGANVGGYFVWSLMDNFEWAEGYRPRFGLVRVEYGTQERVIKDSGRWYSALARTKRVPDAEEALT